MKVFVLGPTGSLGERIAVAVETAPTAHEEREFEDGEFKIRALEDVARETVFIVQSMHGNAARSVSDHLCRLLFFAGSLRDAAAAEVIAVLPYLAFARKDRRTQPRDPVATRYVAALLEAVGIGGVIAMDVHNTAAFDNAFRCPTQHLTALPLFVRHFSSRLTQAERIAVVSPDVGGVKRARAFKDALETETGKEVELAFVEKARSLGVVTGGAFAGNVRDASVVVVDDLISSGTTLARAARACLERGAKEVHAAATHAVLGRGAEQALASDELATIVVADTIDDAGRRCPALASKLLVLDSAPIFAAAVAAWMPDG
jgi:ribose-phosphate pyrophosphokinase